MMAEVGLITKNKQEERLKLLEAIEEVMWYTLAKVIPVSEISSNFNPKRTEETKQTHGLLAAPFDHGFL